MFSGSLKGCQRGLVRESRGDQARPGGRAAPLAAAAPVLLAVLIASCAAPGPTASGPSAPPAAASGPSPGTLALTVVPGKYWTHRIMPFTKVSPSYAGWVETTDGEYVATLLVSGKAGTGDWFGSPEGGRPESVPVWYHAAGISAADPDAVSAASSMTGATAAFSGRDLQKGREYVARFEINHSYDYNETWKKAAGDVNGQPSVLYEACFVYGNPETLTLKPVGHGSADGSSGEPVPSLEGLTTALEIAKTVTLEVQ